MFFTELGIGHKLLVVELGAEAEALVVGHVLLVVELTKLGLSVAVEVRQLSHESTRPSTRALYCFFIFSCSMYVTGLLLVSPSLPLHFRDFFTISAA
jgi:hypothetical protein